MNDLEIIKTFCTEAQLKDTSDIAQGYNLALQAVVSLIETFGKIDGKFGKGVK